jgi:hypothetical protein
MHKPFVLPHLQPTMENASPVPCDFTVHLSLSIEHLSIGGQHTDAPWCRWRGGSADVDLLLSPSNMSPSLSSLISVISL